MPAKSEAKTNKVLQLVDMIIEELKQARAGSYTVVDQLAYLIFIEVLRSQVEEN